MVLNYHIQINIYGDSLIKIEQENISLEKILKNAGVEEFVIVEIPNQPMRPVEATVIKEEKARTEGIINKMEENKLMFQDTSSNNEHNWYCSTPLSHLHDDPILSEQTNCLQDRSNTFLNSDLNVLTAVSVISNDMEPNMSSCAKLGDDIMENCSLFSVTASCSNDKSGEVVKIFEDLDRYNAIRNEMVADIDTSFQSCASAALVEQRSDSGSISGAHDSRTLEDIGSAMENLETAKEPHNDSIQSVAFSSSQSGLQEDDQLLLKQDYICEWPKCHRKLRVSWKKGYAGLREHVRQHTNELIKLCPHCQYGFRTSYQLRKHQLDHHKDLRMIIPKTSRKDNIIIHKLLATCFPSIFSKDADFRTTRAGHIVTPIDMIRKTTSMSK